MEVNSIRNSGLSFLKGDSLMSVLIRSSSWDHTSLGDPESWVFSLKANLNILLGCQFPMVLLWGDEFLCFYNDAFAQRFESSGKHPGALGRKAVEIWPESWINIQ